MMSSSQELRLGWRTAVGSMLGASVGAVGLYAYTSGVFAAALVQQAGMTIGQLALGPLVLALCVGAAAPFAGALMDRYGTLPVIGLSLLGEALGFVLLAILPAGATTYLLAVATLAILGVGTTPLGYSRLIASRFARARGLALGITISGLGVVAMTAPLAANSLIAAFGWRAGYGFLAGIVLVCGAAGLALIASDRSTPATAQVPFQHAADSGPKWAGLERPLFWLLLLVFLLPGIFGAGYMLHLVSLLRDRGYSPGEASTVQAVVGLAVLVGRLGSGAALDRVFGPHAAAATFALSALGIFLLRSDDALTVQVGAFCMGLTIGAELDILAYVISRYFGVKSFGRLYGVAYGALIIATGLSPVLLGGLLTRFGAQTTLAVSAAGLGLAALLLVPFPKYPATETA